MIKRKLSVLLIVVMCMLVILATSCSSPPAPAPVVVVSPIDVHVSDRSMVVFGSLSGRAGDDLNTNDVTEVQTGADLITVDGKALPAR